MNLINKKIGIWGFGIVGKAALRYFTQQKIPTTIFAAQELSAQEKNLIMASQSNLWTQEVTTFLQNHDFVIPSPGIDLRDFSDYKRKFITELDILSSAITKKTIAITGTVGKTSITHLLSTLIQNNKKVLTGGNIGIGMLELLHNQDQAEIIVLELSSFQLEYNRFFAPDLAIWTNFYPNHLDRHTTLDDYFDAKYKIIEYQKENQQALIPLNLAEKIQAKNKHRSIIHYFSPQKPSSKQLDFLSQNGSIFWLSDVALVQSSKTETKTVFPLHKFPQNSFIENWMIIIAALSLHAIPLISLSHTIITLPEHRIEKIITHRGIDFYNDSKSTIMESTHAAVEKLQGKPIIVLVGGLSKGIDRSAALASLKNKIKFIIFFGSEAELLHQAAQKHKISSYAFSTLEESVHHVLHTAQAGDQVLLSPGGSSYDLFHNYEERGKRFKELVMQISQ